MTATVATESCPNGGPDHRAGVVGRKTCAWCDVTIGTEGPVPASALPWEHDDGGRAATGRKGDAGDCVTRAIAIATGLPYGQVYDDLFKAQVGWIATRRKPRLNRAGNPHHASPRTGVFKEVQRAYLEGLGWTWTPTMSIGSGCTVHLAVGELPDVERLVVAVSKHTVAVIDGVIRDTYDPSRGGTRCVYGYFTPPDPHLIR